VLQITIQPNPVKVEKYSFESPHGVSLQQIYNESKIKVPIEQCVFVVNDSIISDFAHIPKDNSIVTIKAIPAGEVASTVFGLASSIVGGAVVGGAIGGPLGAVIGGFVGALSFFINYTATPDAVKSNYSFAGSQNRSAQYEVVPVVYGTTKIAPSFGGSDYTEYVESGNTKDCYLHQLYILGYAPTKVESVSIGDIRIAYRDGTDTLVYDTANNLDPVLEIIDDGVFTGTNYPYQTSESHVSVVCTYETPQYFTTPDNIATIDIELGFLSGLATIKNNNSLATRSVSFDIHAKRHGETTWKALALGASYEANQREAFYRTKTFDLASAFSETRGQYDIKITRKTADSSDSSVIDQLTFVSARTYQIDSAGDNVAPVDSSIASDLVCMTLKVKASEAISGSIDNLSVVVTRNVNDYTGSSPDTDDSSNWTVQETHNPASMFLDVLQNELLAQHPVVDSFIDWASLQNWHVWCDTNNYTCNGILLQETTVQEELKKICAVGRAEYAIIDGKYTIKQFIEQDTAVQMFTARNILKDSFSVTRSFDTNPDGVSVQFINASVGYIVDERQINDSYTTNLSIEYDYVDNAEQAGNLGQVVLNVSQLQILQYQFGASLDALVATRGDKVLLQHDGALVGITSGRIKSIEEDGANLVSITTDETCLLEAGVSYGVTVRGITSGGDDVFETFTLATVAVDTYTTTLELDHSEPHNIAVGDLFSFGELTSETVPCLITNIQYNAQGYATINAVEYNEDVYSTSAVGAWTSSITPLGSAQNVVTTMRFPNVDQTLESIIGRQNNTPTTKIFQNQPTVPYNVGDLWLNGVYLYDATVARDDTESFTMSDWRLRSSSAFDVLNKDTFNIANPEYRWQQIPGDALPYNLLTATDYDVTSGDATKENLLVNDGTDWEPTGTLEAVTVEGDAITNVETEGTFTSVYAVGRYEESGYMGEAFTNLIVSPDTPTTQDVVIDAGDYVLQCYRGTITCTYGEASYGVPLEFTSTGETLTLTMADCKYGSLTKTSFIPPYVNGSFVATYDSLAITGTTATIKASIVNVPTGSSYGGIVSLYKDANDFIDFYMENSRFYINIMASGDSFFEDITDAVTGDYIFTFDWTTGIILTINGAPHNYSEGGSIYGWGTNGYGFLGTDYYGFSDSVLVMGVLTDAYIGLVDGKYMNGVVTEVEV